MPDQFKGADSHFSIAMPNGDTCRIYTHFHVYATDEGGEIVRFNCVVLKQICDAVAAHLKGNEVQSIELRETLTDLPHSPERTLMRSHD
jgi:hypothetical protein